MSYDLEYDVRSEVKNMKGEVVDTIDLPSDIFEVPNNESLMHQALVRQLANARFGNHHTKTRGEARGGGAKPWRQKGTGRARHGSRRSPIWVGGGVAHGPRTRSHRKKMPRQMRRAALRSALSAKAAQRQVVVVDVLELDEPKTQVMREILSSLSGGEGTTLVLLPGKNVTVEKSVRNLTSARTLHAKYLNIRDLLSNDVLVMPLDALSVIKSYLGKDR